MTDRFQSPIWLLSLLGAAALAAIYIVLQRRRRRYVARFTNAGLLASIAPKRPGWRRHLTFSLLLLAIASLCLGAAKPTGTVRVPVDRATVILAIDVSRSMQATDVLPSRLEAAQAAAKEFTKLLPDRIRLGLVSFSGQVSVRVPPTTDRDTVNSGIDGLQLGDSTAIGEAIFASLDAIATFAAQSGASDSTPVPARIVLMSDGYNNVGRDPLSAAQAAAAAGVPVSTIAFGTTNGTVDLGGQAVPVPADRSTLQQVAQISGGTFHTATTESELKAVYGDIGSQIGYQNQKQDISWRFLIVALVLGLGAGAAALLWSGRLL
jgi:Ca-activated chloride channel family protein